MDQLSRFATWLGAVDDTEEAADDDAFLLDMTEEAREEQIDNLLQQFSVLLEYERLQEMVPPGMYIMPALDSLLTWHGVLFARQGLYRGGIFKFQLQLPEDYPESPPELRFLSDMFHPMVDPASGNVDLGAFFPDWKAGRDYASFALPHLHRALLRREYFAGSARPPLNPEAREMFINDPSTFAQRAAECARSSTQKAYDNPSGTPLQFTKGPSEAHDKILENLRSLDASYSIEDRKAMFVNWFCDHYAHEQCQVRMSQKLETIHFDVEAENSPQSAEGSGTDVDDASLRDR